MPIQIRLALSVFADKLFILVLRTTRILWNDASTTNKKVRCIKGSLFVFELRVHSCTDPPQSLTAVHVLRCEDKDSHYVIQEDRRHSVIVPLKTPPPGNTSVILCFRFMCLSSCIGSLNRRPTKLIFTLETLR